MSDQFLISKEELNSMIKQAIIQTRLEVVGSTMTDIELAHRLGNPSRQTIKRFIDEHGIKSGRVGDRRLFKRAQVEKVLNDLIK